MYDIMTFEEEFLPRENDLYYDEDTFDHGKGLIGICTNYDICYRDPYNPLRCYKDNEPCIKVFLM